jgi:hypothetical protein
MIVGSSSDFAKWATYFFFVKGTIIPPIPSTIMKSCFAASLRYSLKAVDMRTSFLKSSFAAIKGAVGIL